MERTLGMYLKSLVVEQLLSAGREEREITISKKSFDNDKPAITIVVDGGWSKRVIIHWNPQ